MKKWFIALLGLALAITVLYPTNSASAEGPPEIVPYTVEKYVDFLEGNGELEAAREFESLPKGKQKKILKYLFDPKVLEEMFTAGDGLQVGESKKLKNGDIVVSKKRVEKKESDLVLQNPGEFSIASTTRRKAEYIADHTVLGYAAVRIYTYVNYETYGTTTVSTVGKTGGEAIRNVNPILTIVKSDSDSWKSNNKAYGESYFTWKFGVSGYGYTIGVRRQVTIGYPSGYDTGYTTIIN
ncbi:hypothetical protein [Sutcliffiella horikoshii]|uniref:hypothetical protein n=1 Tax=Sutcliffiella horikoshii TaxID=79883 RepID=UPI003CF2B37F